MTGRRDEVTGEVGSPEKWKSPEEMSAAASIEIEVYGSIVVKRDVTIRIWEFGSHQLIEADFSNNYREAVTLVRFRRRGGRGGLR
ncbi:hypothetical protein Q3G72_015035 [Acer saccharum]|nr:hypothetical protein Q3G72_015035 [Acer saccharum]